jgi:hypothetical protein
MLGPGSHEDGSANVRTCTFRRLDSEPRGEGGEGVGAAAFQAREHPHGLADLGVVVGRVLLAATAGHPGAEPGLIAALEALTTMITAPHGPRPGWWLPASMHPPSVKADPSGSAATGVAHGIAGPLAFLATASASGRTVPGQDDAIRHASTWLLGWKADGTWQWPTSVSGTELDAGTARVTGRQDAWCYGTPGPRRARPPAQPRRSRPLGLRAPAVMRACGHLGEEPARRRAGCVCSAGWRPTS